jgi:acetylornithine deacetylase/succinyl-diaminopimelate desuccinylase-like protein
VVASAPQTEYSAGRAFRHVVALSVELRPIGTAAHARAREYILSELRALGLVPQVQATLVFDPQSAVYPARSSAANIQNIVARLPGAGDGQAILLMAHYDSVATAPGARDDAAGVATLLETARALLAGPALQNDVVVLFTDAEEVGLLGALGFVKQHL